MRGNGVRRMEQEVRGSSERMRQLLEMAVTTGRSWQSSQTGYIHYCYNQLDEDFHHPIPFYENFLFILALMRTRHVENFNEGKEMLSRLLHYQNSESDKSRGNFPIYLHDYPKCSSSSQAIKLLPIFYFITKNYQHVLGTALKAQLRTAIEKGLEYARRLINEKPLPYTLSMKVGACCQAIGQLLNNKKAIGEGQAILKNLERGSHIPDWNSPSTLGEIILAMQMIYPSISNSPEKELWNHISNTWHRSSQSYCGVGWNEVQRGVDPQPTLYDYFLGYFGSKFSYRGFLDYPVQLQTALVQPSEDELPSIDLPLSFQGSVDNLLNLVSQHKHFAYSACFKNDEIKSIPHEKGFHVFKLLWGMGCRVHSLVCQATNAPRVDLGEKETTVALFVTLPPKTTQGDLEKNQEISLFVDRSESLKILVEGQAATTFRLGEKLLISDGEMEIEVVFTLVSGHGGFYGHIMRGNRPSQTDLKGNHRFEAYDWQIFLRSVLRNPDCLIKVQIHMREIPKIEPLIPESS
jgi:hypothetical protein